MVFFKAMRYHHQEIKTRWSSHMNGFKVKVTLFVMAVVAVWVIDASICHAKVYRHAKFICHN